MDCCNLARFGLLSRRSWTSRGFYFSNGSWGRVLKKILCPQFPNRARLSLMQNKTCWGSQGVRCSMTTSPTERRLVYEVRVLTKSVRQVQGSQADSAVASTRTAPPVPAKTSACAAPTDMKLLDWMPPPTCPYLFSSVTFSIACPPPYRDPVDVRCHRPSRRLAPLLHATVSGRIT